MAFVTFPLICDSRTDHMLWAGERLHRYAETLGVKLKGEHRLEMVCAPAALDDRWRLRCSCGWEKRFYSTQLLTTGSPVFHDALKEHVMSFTDPDHYTYYPQGV